jgi:hypothetical protein
MRKENTHNKGFCICNKFLDSEGNSTTYTYSGYCKKDINTPLIINIVFRCTKLYFIGVSYYFVNKAKKIKKNMDIKKKIQL